MAKIILYTIYDHAAIGIRSLGAYLRAKGHCVDLVFLGSASQGITAHETLTPDILDALQDNRKNDPTMIHKGSFFETQAAQLGFAIPPAFLDFIRNRQASIIGFSCRSFLVRHFSDWFAAIRKAAPHALIAAGGFGPTLEPEVLLRQGADLVIRGEGEIALEQLAVNLDARHDWRTGSNLSYLAEDAVVHTAFAPLIRNLDAVPAPLYYCAGIHTVSENGDELTERDPLDGSSRLHLLFSRGCIGSCSYCSAGHWRDLYIDSGLTVPKYRYPSNEHIFDVLLSLKQPQHKVAVFYDDFFVRPYDELIDFFLKFKEKIGLNLAVNLHEAFLTKHPDIYDFAVNAGVSLHYLPIQCANEKFCREFFCRHNNQKAVLHWSKRSMDDFIPVRIDFIDGFEYLMDKTKYLQDNLDFIRQLEFSPAFQTLVRISVSYLRHHANSPLLKKYPDIVKSGLPVREFLYRASLMHFRLIYADEEFENFRSNRYYQDHPEVLLELYAAESAAKHEDYVQNKLQRLKGQEVYVWGGGGMYYERRGLLTDVKPQAIIVDIPVSEKRIDGLPVRQVHEILAEREIPPILLCTQNPLSLARRLVAARPDYPKEKIVNISRF